MLETSIPQKKRINNESEVIKNLSLIFKEDVDQLVTLYNKGHYKIVVSIAKSLIEKYPDSFFIWNILGAALKILGNFELALKAFNKSIQINPNYADGFNNIGIILTQQGKINEAIIAYEKALFLDNKYVEAYVNYGNALRIIGKTNEAKKAYNKAILIDPNYINAYIKLGHAFLDQDKIDDATQVFQKVIAYDKKNALAHFNLGQVLLKTNSLREGFEKYEYRWKLPQYFSQWRNFSKPIWNRKIVLNSKSLLLWSEQGIGDTLIWSSYLPILTSKAQHCILECQEKIVPLLKRSFPKIEIKPENRELDAKREDFDFHLPMGSLYKNLLPEITQMNKTNPCLIPDDSRVNYWKRRLKSLGKGPYIGLSWKSSHISSDRIQNYAPLIEWKPIFEVPDVTFINLQYKDFENDLAIFQKKFEVKIHNFDDLDHYNNIEDVAALCRALDIVVSVKMTVPLISAGVGTTTKLVNWRQSSWSNILLNPSSSSVKIFERNTWESWENTFQLVAEDIFNDLYKN